ncbi:hypothetical protein MMC30_006379 [Trapelia coarctata]|nr:hypothetical protein [Trapelia coarctata]
MDQRDTVPMVKVVDTPALLVELIDDLSDVAVDPPSLFVDLEGENLSWTCSILIITLYVEPKYVICLIDVWILQALTFTTPGKSKKTLKDILASASIPKVFFDVRHNFEALQEQYNIALRVVHDVQLMEKALHPPGYYAWKPGTSLARCIENDAVMPQSVRLA